MARYRTPQAEKLIRDKRYNLAEFSELPNQGDSLTVRLVISGNDASDTLRLRVDGAGRQRIDRSPAVRPHAEATIDEETLHRLLDPDDDENLGTAIGAGRIVLRGDIPRLLANLAQFEAVFPARGRLINEVAQ